MCGRYYLDEDGIGQIRQMVKEIDDRQGTGDIHPSQPALVLAKEGGGLRAKTMVWGFPHFQKKGVIFNARWEGALEKRLFRESLLHRRCIIPAQGFYEWDSSKNKVAFSRKDGQLLYMAGFYQAYQEGDRFVILTTHANPWVFPVHGRMPLILEPSQLEAWAGDGKVEDFAAQNQVALQSSSDYFQERLPF